MNDEDEKKSPSLFFLAEEEMEKGMVKEDYVKERLNRKREEAENREEVRRG